MIALNNISLSLGGQNIIDKVNLVFPENQTHVLIGSSGCGKSTLIRLILGLLRPTRGQVRVNNLTVSKKRQRAIVRKIGYVVQDGGLFPHLTARGNLKLVADLHHMSEEATKKRILELTELVHLKKQTLDKYPHQISGGQKQRVALMRALIHDPEILLLDEPLGALDPIVRANLQEELKEIFESLKKTVVLVTHDIGEAAYFGHTVTLMSKGKIIQTGSFLDLVQKPATPFVTKFLGAQKPNPYLKDLL